MTLDFNAQDGSWLSSLKRRTRPCIRCTTANSMTIRVILTIAAHAYCTYHFFFFFSSRRRHTRFKCDWSSDVCSSDLWLLVGFIHGVMNTDNTSISGETIDYGPCAFMDHYDPAKVFSSIDELGRYAYANQPRIALWNLTRLAECLLPLLADEQDKAIEEAQSALGNFVETFDAAYQAGLRRKLGLFMAAN